MTEKVRILGKSGYTAYIGDVENSAVTGNGTLIIGTHLIYMGALNEQIYKIAQKSESDSSQTDSIAELYFTHHTRSDGVTYNLKKNVLVGVFEIYDAHDLENMAEPEPLKIQYDALKEQNDKSDTTSRNIKLIGQFFCKQFSGNGNRL